MGYILGIDAGGTYTDSVLVESETKRIINKSKSLTTKDDLTRGIRNSVFDLLKNESKPIMLVSLSTTLATNAIVENKGHPCGLLLIGRSLEEPCPADIIEMVPGLFDINGREINILDEDKCREALLKMKGKVDALAVSGFASTRNPKHELRVKALAKEILGLPVICAHELSDGLGFYERSVTAILNASLIPIIQELIEAVKYVLNQLEIYAPLMVVKGDGTITEASKAAFRPIETIMSGPAAGIVGGSFLADMDNAIIFDIGGTTSDVASIEEGQVRATKSGAIIGGYSTKVKAAQVFTYGAGGDSRVKYRSDTGLMIDTKRVVPMCTIGSTWPLIENELKEIEGRPATEFRLSGSWDCFIYSKIPNVSLSQLEIDILNVLKEHPHSIVYLHRLFKTPVLERSIENLVNIGAIERAAFTPTDLLYITGRYNGTPTDAPLICGKIIAKSMGITLDEFKKRLARLFTERLATICIQSMAGFEGHYENITTDTAKYFFHKSFSMQDPNYFSIDFSVNKPIVALGAPAEKWVTTIRECLDCQVITPEHFEVACAVGAAVGQVKETITVLVRPSGRGFNTFTSTGCHYFEHKEDATNFGIKFARDYIHDSLISDSTYEYKVLESHEDVYSKAIGTTPALYLETKIFASAVGQPPWGQ